MLACFLKVCVLMETLSTTLKVDVHRKFVKNMCFWERFGSSNLHIYFVRYLNMHTGKKIYTVDQFCLLESLQLFSSCSTWTQQRIWLFHTKWNDLQSDCTPKNECLNRPFAQLLPGLETGHPVTVGQSPAHESHTEQSETETRKQLSARRKHWNHMQVTDRPSPDARL